MSDIDRRGHDQLQPAGDRKPTPIERIVPEPLRVAASSFYGFYSETLKGSVSLATRLKWWIQEEGLAIEEAKEAMRRLMTPERSADIDTAPKAIAALSAEVGIILRDRRARERAAQLRDQMNEPADPNDAEKLAAVKIAAALNFGIHANGEAK